MRILITIPLPDPKLNPNSRCHWAAKVPLKDDQRLSGFAGAHDAIQNCDDIIHPEKWKEVILRPNWYSARAGRRDRDNAVASLKWAFDGIARYFGVDDEIFVPYPVRFEVDRENPRVEITMEVEQTN